MQPNPEFLGPLGWGIWPQPAKPGNHQVQNEEVPNLIPIQHQLNEGDEQIQENHAEQADIEEVIQAVEEIDANILLDEGQVIATDALTESDIDDLPPPLIDDAEDFLDLPYLQNIPQFQAVEEIQEDDLLGNVGRVLLIIMHLTKLWVTIMLRIIIKLWETIMLRNP